MLFRVVHGQFEGEHIASVHIGRRALLTKANFLQHKGFHHCQVRGRNEQGLMDERDSVIFHECQLTPDEDQEYMLSWHAAGASSNKTGKLAELQEFAKLAAIGWESYTLFAIDANKQGVIPCDIDTGMPS